MNDREQRQPEPFSAPTPAGSTWQRSLSAVCGRAIAGLTDLHRALAPDGGTADDAAQLGRARDAVRHFVAQILAAYAECPGLLRLWACVSPESRSEIEWIGPEVGDNGDEFASPDAILAEISKHMSADAPIAVGATGAPPAWALQRRIGPAAIAHEFPAASTGTLVGLFESAQSAILAGPDLDDIAAHLELGVRLLRQAQDSIAVDALSHRLVTATEPSAALSEIAEIVKRHLSSDGVRAYLVERTPAGPRLMLRYHTGMPALKPAPRLIRDRVGLVDWVVRNDDWLLIPRTVPFDQTGTEPEDGISGDHGRVGQPAISTAAREPRVPDQERTMLLVPLHSRGQVAGCLVVWRTTDDPYDCVLDVESLQRIAPHVVSACARVIQLEKMRAEIAEIAALHGRLSEPDTGLGEAYAAVAAAVGKLEDAARTMLLHHDTDRPGRLYHGASWSADADHKAAADALARELRDVRVDASADPKTWPRAIAEALGRGVPASASLRIRRVLNFPDRADTPPEIAVVVMDASGSDLHPHFDQDLLSHVASSFLRYAGAMLHNYLGAYAATLIGRLGMPGHSQGSLDVLQRAAELLTTATAADETLIYTGESGKFRVVSAYPVKHELEGLDVAPGSLTDHSIAQASLFCLPDVDNASGANGRFLDRDSLAKICQPLGWATVRSWLCCPVVYNQRCIGVLKILTKPRGGAFLGKHHSTIARVVADRTAWEIQRAERHIMLAKLNEQAAQLAGKQGEEFAHALLHSLAEWSQEFVKKAAEVAVVAWSGSGQNLICQGTPNLDKGALAHLQWLSRQMSRAQCRWQRGRIPAAADAVANACADAFDDDHLAQLAGVAVPILLPAEPQLTGHIFVLHAQPLTAEELGNVREAAREYAILINGERLRQEWLTWSSVFRHVLVSPAQGLVTVGKLLARLAENAGVQGDEIARLKGRLTWEAEQVRLWKENQRLYFSEHGQVEIVPRQNALRAILERNLERYRSWAQERGITMKCDLRKPGSITFLFDAFAVDILISNLLDNAVKYAFYNSMLTLGADTDQRDVIIWVEDIGKEIPLGLDVYQQGQRFGSLDLLRVIPGEGLGLFMASAIVRAHGGTIEHTCVEEPTTGELGPDRQPFRVRFTVRLPHHWSQQRSSPRFASPRRV